MKSLRIPCTGIAPVHFFKALGGVAASVMLAAAPFGSSAAEAKAAPVKVAAASPRMPFGQGVGDFYRMRRDALLWLAPGAGTAAPQLIEMLKGSAVDGLDPTVYRTDELDAALRSVAGSTDRAALLRADRMLSDAFARYVRDLRRNPDIGIIYIDSSLKPVSPSPFAALIEAASAPSLADYVARAGWANPLYGELRRALTTRNFATPHEEQTLKLNLERARALPAGKGRYILVNAAEQRLFTFENGRQLDAMNVVVGKPKNPTPMMSAYMRFAALNPYWYVPPDLAAERIAPKVLNQGLKYLDELGHQVMTDWTADATVIDPRTIDWKAVAAGKTEVRIRQLPGPHNSMGRMKFMFPNEEGIYLHDNPERELFSEASRLYSGGCVRLEDAARLGQWLFGKPLVWEGAGTEEQVALPDPVPVYITYLTAKPGASGIAYFDDIYGRDAARLAQLGLTATEAVAGR
ncbi:MAG: L,D-transpeptidase family protein [Sphingomicrobium sp.]